MTYPQSPTFPAVKAFLLAGMAPLLDDDVFLQNGPLPQWPKGKVLAFGVGQPAVTRTTKRAGYSDAFQESALLWCLAYSWATKDDGTTLDDREADVVAILESVRVLIEQDKTLGGLVMDAKIGPDDRWTPSNFDSDPGSQCVFSIATTAAI